MSLSTFSRGLHFCRMRRISYTMDVFCLLYLLLILLMGSGDVETNPGPDTVVGLSTVSEPELLKLAQEIDSSNYDAVGISLGIPHAQLQAILDEKLKSHTNALLNVFMKWKAMQLPSESNEREILAVILRENKLVTLSKRLLDESLIPNSTEGPSRLLEKQTKTSAESGTEPLSPELVEQCAKDFKFKYRSTLCKIRADPLKPSTIVDIDKLYTNPVLEKEDGTGKQTIYYNEFLHLKVNEEFPKRIMVQGEAGTGKTTLCAKIAWDWINGRYFSHFVWVLIIPLHEFKQHTIGKIAKSYLAKDNPATVSQITDYIQSNPDKVFIACDGLDEVSDIIMKKKSCESRPTDQMQLQPSQSSVISSEAFGSSSGDIGLEDILCSYQLASCPVLVTTRPWRAVEIRSDVYLMTLYTFIRIEGFNRENLSVYIHKCFPENDKANQLIQLISENDVISENMPYYPIYVAMLKELYKQEVKEIKSLKTVSQLFTKMIAYLKEHYAQKEEKKVGSLAYLAYLKEIGVRLGPMSKQVLNGLLKNTLVFGEDDSKSKDTACRVGILSQEDRITTSMDIDKGNSHVQLSVFFPHKLFREYIAGVYLASLYKSEPDEFNSLIEQLLPRKEEFRYLLYFTVSQDKSIANDVMNSMLQGLKNVFDIGKELPFIVDVAFESQDPGVAALVKDKVLSEPITLTIARDMTAHTVAGYAFIGPRVVELDIRRDCGPAMSLDVAEIICSMPFLEKVSLQGAFHHCFFATLAKKGNQSKVQILQLHIVQCATPDSSRDLGEALCSMLNLTDLTLEMVLDEEFYSILKEKASFIKVQTLKLHATQCPTPVSSRDLAEAVCSMPKLTDLTLIGRYLNEEFYYTLEEKASSIKVQTLKLDGVQCPTQDSSHHLAKALCAMPKLTYLTLLVMNPNAKFFSTLSLEAKASSIQTLKLDDVKCPTPDSSHDLVEALCSMPNLNNLTLLGSELNGEFCSTLKAKASTIQGCFPQIRKGNFRLNGVAQDDLKSFLDTLTRLQSSRSRLNKRQLSCTQSRVPQDGHKAKKQFKCEVE